jgi:hypothetical protein
VPRPDGQTPRDAIGGYFRRTRADLAGYYLFAGSALDMTEQLNGNAVKRDARDGYYAAARVRLSF